LKAEYVKLRCNRGLAARKISICCKKGKKVKGKAEKERGEISKFCGEFLAFLPLNEISFDLKKLVTLVKN